MTGPPLQGTTPQGLAETVKPAGRKKPHVSPSQMDTYFRCGEQYRRAYILRDRVPPGVALIKGGSVHKAAEVNYQQKIASHRDLPVATLKEAAAAYLDTEVGGGLMLTPEESSRGLNTIIGEVRDRAAGLVDLFRTEVAPSVQPVLVEKYVRIDLPKHSHDLLGRLDVADASGYIRDLKTASRRKNQDEIDRSDQLTFYHAAYRQQVGNPAVGVILDVLVDTKRPAVQRLESERTEADQQVFLNRLNAMLRGVQAGSFPPAPLGSWCCSPKYCGYWFTCPYVNSERRAAAESEV